MYLARKAYKELHTSAVSIQTGMRGMAARIELRFRRQTRAAIIVQVIEPFNEMRCWFKKILHIFILFLYCFIFTMLESVFFNIKIILLILNITLALWLFD